MRSSASSGTILIEPICRAAIPGYFLNDLDQAAGILAEVGHPRLKILFDCYHVETEHGALPRPLPRRRAPSSATCRSPRCPAATSRRVGALDYGAVLPAHASSAGYAGAFGCEYRPLVPPETTLRAAPAQPDRGRRLAGSCMLKLCKRERPWHPQNPPGGGQRHSGGGGGLCRRHADLQVRDATGEGAHQRAGGAQPRLRLLEVLEARRGSSRRSPSSRATRSRCWRTATSSRSSTRTR